MCCVCRPLQISALVRRKGWAYLQTEFLGEVLQSTAFLSTNAILFMNDICRYRYSTCLLLFHTFPRFFYILFSWNCVILNIDLLSGHLILKFEACCTHLCNSVFCFSKVLYNIFYLFIILWWSLTSIQISCYLSLLYFVIFISGGGGVIQFKMLQQIFFFYKQIELLNTASTICGSETKLPHVCKLELMLNWLFLIRSQIFMKLQCMFMKGIKLWFSF